MDWLVVPHDGGGDHDDAFTVESVAPANIKVVPHHVEGGVETAELFPAVGPDEHAGRIDGEDIGAGVVLVLVELVLVDHGQPFGARGHPQTDVNEFAGVVPADLFTAGDRDGRRNLDAAQKFFERVRRGCGVVVDEPQPAVIWFCAVTEVCRHGCGVGDGGGEALAVTECDSVGGFRYVVFQQPASLFVRCCFNNNQVVEFASLVLKRVENYGQMFACAVADKDCCNVYLMLN